MQTKHIEKSLETLEERIDATRTQLVTMHAKVNSLQSDAITMMTRLGSVNEGMNTILWMFVGWSCVMAVVIVALAVKLLAG